MADYHYLWTAYTAEVCVCWEVQEWPDGRKNRQMVSLHIYGEVVDSKSLRAVPVGAINAADPADYPCWRIDVDIPTMDEIPAPPTYRQMVEAWRTRTGKKRRTPNIERARVKVGPREPGEDVDMFYRRVADAYRMLADKSGKPTSELAVLAGVEKHAAARWVHEARKRGHLPATTRGKVQR